MSDQAADLLAGRYVPEDDGAVEPTRPLLCINIANSQVKHAVVLDAKHRIRKRFHYLLQIDILRDGTILKDPTGSYQYNVEAACSGIRSLAAMMGMAIIYGTLFFRRWWKRAAIFASAFPLAIIGNTLRLLAIVAASELAPFFGAKGQDWGNKVHEGGPGGIYSLLPYVPVFIGLFLLGRWLREERRAPTIQSETLEPAVTSREALAPKPA